MKPSALVTLGVVTLSLMLALSARAQFTVNTIPSWDGSTFAYPFGSPNTSTYGQTVTAPSGNPYLNTFTFVMNLPASTTFQSYVYAWNGTSATGPALYTSGITATAGTGFQTVTFNAGGVSVSPGSSYVLFASVSQDPGSSGSGQWGFLNSNAYSGGDFVFLNNGANTSLWTGSAWTQNWGGPGNDLAFQATFGPTPTPEPGTLALAGLGAISLLAARRRK